MNNPLEKFRKFCQLSVFAVTRTMYLLSATGCSNFPNVTNLYGSWSVLSTANFQLATTSSAVTGCPSDQRAFGSMRKRNCFLSSEICQWLASPGMYSRLVG